MKEFPCSEYLIRAVITVLEENPQSIDKIADAVKAQIQEIVTERIPRVLSAWLKEGYIVGQNGGYALSERWMKLKETFRRVIRPQMT